VVERAREAQRPSEWAAIQRLSFSPGDVVTVGATVRKDDKGKKYYELDEPLLVRTPAENGAPLYEDVRNVVPVDTPPYAVSQRVKLPLFIVSITNDPMSRIASQDEEATIHVRTHHQSVASKGRLVDVFPPHLEPSLFTRMSTTRNARWFHHDNFFSYHFSDGDLRVLNEWAGSNDRRAAPNQLRALVAERLDGSERGLRARRALSSLGFLNPFSESLLSWLPQQYRGRPLEGVHFHYNGHMTRAMFPLFPMLHSLGLSGGSATRSGYSGTYPVEGIMNAQLEGPRPKPHQVRTEQKKRVGPNGKQSANQWMEKCALDAVARGEMFIADKAANLLSGTPSKALLDAMRAGKIRFLVHNADDHKALAPYLNEIYAVDVAGSLLKSLEAKIIGEQYALLAAREVREKWGVKIAGVPKYVVGFGLLGSSVAEAMARFAAPPGTEDPQAKRAASAASGDGREDFARAGPEDLRAYRKKVIVVERDPTAAQKARDLGFTVMSDEPPKDGRGVVVVASSGVGIDAANAARFPRDTLVLGLTSAGKGIDLGSLRELAKQSGGGVEKVRERTGGYGFDRFEPLTFNDLEVSFSGRKLTVINDGFPLNLFDEAWSDRFNVTAAAVALGVVAAVKLDEPGLHAVPEADSIEVRKLFQAAGLMEPHPLDTHDPAQLAALAADMNAYR
jgi:hypothetical protein